MAARVQHIGFLGTYNDAGAKVDAMALLGEQSIRYDATLALAGARLNPMSLGLSLQFNTDKTHNIPFALAADRICLACFHKQHRKFARYKQTPVRSEGMEGEGGRSSDQG